MTEGSLRLNETARISLSYTEMTSTFPWHQSVTAFCQWTILSGSYVALRSSVCSMTAIRDISGPTLCGARGRADSIDVQGRAAARTPFIAVLTVVGALASACASTGTPR